MKKNYTLILFSSVLFLFSLSMLNGQVYTSQGSGDFNTGATWGGSAPSTASNNLTSSIIVAAGHTVTRTGDLNIKSGSVVTVQGVLVVTGDVDFNNGCTILVESGGVLNIQGSGLNKNNSTDVTINGSLDVDTDFESGTGSTITGTGSISVDGEMTFSGSGNVFGQNTDCSECNYDVSGQASIFRWTGDADVVFNNTSNWEQGSVPSSTDVVVIPTGLATYPEFSGVVDFKNLSIEDGAEFVLLPGAALTVSNDFTLFGSSGRIDFGNATVIIGGNMSLINGLNVTYSTLNAANNIRVTGDLIVGGGILPVGDGIVDCIGDFNASNASITFAAGTLTGTLKLSGSVTSLGALSETSGTVLYYGGTSMVSDTYYNLSIGSGNTHTMSGPSTVNNDLTVSSGTMGVEDQSLTVLGDVDINGGMTLTTGTLDVKGNFTSNGTLTEGTGTVSLTGSSAQIVAGSDLGFYKLTVNNSNGASLSNDASISEELTLTNGHLTLGSSNLTLGSTAKAIAGTLSSSNMIVAAGTGELRKEFTSIGTFDFPVGTIAGGDEYSPVTLTFNSGTTFAGTEYVGVRVQDARCSSMNSGVNTYINRNWVIEPSVGISNYDYDVELHYVDADVVLGSFTEGDIVPVKYSAGQWYQADMINSVFTNTIKQGSGFMFAASNYMVWGGLTTFSEFGGGGGSGQPLPVELTSFNGACDNGVISLAWQTASENNSSHFDVEKSRDGENWTVLSTIAAAGTSNEIISYQAVDHSATDGNNYFRLRQVDIDGTEKLYDPINVSCEAISVGYFSSYPNPSGNAFQIIVNNEDLVGECVLNMVDAQGKVIERKAIEVKPGINMFVMNQNLNPGMYFLNVSNGSKSTPVIRHSIK